MYEDRIMLNIGHSYYFGKNVKQDIEKAIHFYDKASLLGSVEATIQLAEIYYYGSLDLPINIKKSFQIYKRGLDSNDFELLRNVAYNYAEQADHAVLEKTHKQVKYYEKSLILFIQISKDTRFKEISKENIEKILSKKMIDWKKEYHLVWNTSNDINPKIILILLISKYRKDSKNFIISKVFIKYISFNVIKFLCNISQN